MLEYLPLEIQEEFLKRLPLNPLIQFQSVSKTWKGLIDSRNFIASYGVRHPDPDRFILRYVDPDYPDEYKYITLVDNDDDHSLAQQEFIPTFPGLIKTLEPHSSVVGSCLLCLKVYCKYPNDHPSSRRGIFIMLRLYNPSIRKSVGIQMPPMYDSPNEIFGNDRFDDVIGFGVCPATLDPIILKIECIDYKREMKDMSSVSVPWKVQVFTLSTGTWSILATNLPCKSIILRGDQVVIGRFIYWIAYDMRDAEDGRSQSHYLIVSFDLTAKGFKEINLTDGLTNQSCKIQTISKLREFLVLVEDQTEFEEDVSVCYRLWMMKEQGVSRSFTKLYTINLPNATINRILGFRMTDELIMETRGPLEQYADVQIYEQNLKHADYLGIYGEPNLCLITLMVIYITIVCS